MMFAIIASGHRSSALYSPSFRPWAGGSSARTQGGVGVHVGCNVDRSLFGQVRIVQGHRHLQPCNQFIIIGQSRSPVIGLLAPDWWVFVIFRSVFGGA